MEDLLKYILEETASKNIEKKIATNLITLLKSEEKNINDDFAIIGMAVNMPKSKNTNEFWGNLLKGEDCITKFPLSRRVNLKDYLISNNIDPETVEYTEAAYLDEIDNFDYNFFKLSPKEASLMDPHQRLFLQTAWQSIEDAGLGGDRLVGSKTGVYVGYATNDINRYINLIYNSAYGSMPISIAGNMSSILGSRLSYILDLKGPSMMIDTACSSSLVAVHQACNGIRNKDCDIAIVGGVRVDILPTNDVKLGIESSDGKTKSFDNRSNGTGIGEGVVSIIIKPLKEALKDGDNIHAIIKGSAINQDGSSVGITAPNAASQTDVILQACKNADVDISTISYIEAHGTGTELGDPIEIEGITEAFEKSTNKKQFCGIGSVKTNIGHLYEASGIAGLVKGVLSLENKKIPKSINFEIANKRINFEESSVYFTDKNMDWDCNDGPRRCGVSSFGFSGTNCHVIIEESPKTVEITDENINKNNILTISAKSEYSLKSIVNEYKTYLKSNKPNIDNLCYTANTGRGHYKYRLAIVFNNLEELNSEIDIILTSNFNLINNNKIFYGENSIALSNKKPLLNGELSKEQVRELSKEVNSLVNQYNSNESDDENIILNICSLYAKGANVNWGKLYENKKLHKISIPVYQFENNKCWFKVSKAANESNTNNEEIKYLTSSFTPKSPLVEKCVIESIDTDIFVTDFEVDRHWVLKDHMIVGHYLIPGTTYLEMAQSAARKYFSDDAIEFKDVMFIKPVILNYGEKRRVHIKLIKYEDEIKFTIGSVKKDSFDNDEKEWNIHSKGTIRRINNPAMRVLDIESVKKECSKVVKDISLNDITNGHVKFGPRWLNYKKLRIGEEHVLAEINIPSEFISDLNEFYLHPSLLDMAVNGLSITLGKNYLPLIYKTFKLYGPTPAKIYSYIKMKSKDVDAETLAFDILLLDENGVVFGEIEDYSIKKVHDFNKLVFSKNNIYSKIKWIDAPYRKVEKDSSVETIILIKNKDYFIGDLLENLFKYSNNIIEVEIGESFQKINDNKFIIGSTYDDYDKLFTEMKGKRIEYVIHCASLTEVKEENTLKVLNDGLDNGVYSLFYLTKAILNNKIKGKLNISIVTDYAYEVSKREEIIKPYNNSLIALGKVIRKEYKNLILRSIDIDKNITSSQLVDEIFKGADEDVAYRNNSRYISKIEARDLELEESYDLEFKTEGAYVLTGGTGGIGLEICKYISSKNKVNLILINRSKVPERSKWNEIIEKNQDKKLCKIINTVNEIEGTGCKVTFYSCDISDYDKMQIIYKDIKNNFGKINGIIHCAGVPGDGFIVRKEDSKFKNVIIPKIYGAWVLDDITKNENMDFFVVFSSIATVLCLEGQGDYTAANAYLDAFSSWRNKKGRKTTAINWAAWSESGMAADNHVNIDNIVKSVSNKSGIQAFDEILKKNTDRVVVGALNYKLLEKKDYQLLLDNADKKVRKKVNVALKGKNDNKYTVTENKLGEIWAYVLGLNEINVYASFYDLGGDSILATQLLQETDKDYPDTVDITDIFSYSTIFDMAQYISSKKDLDEDGDNVIECENNNSDLDSLLAKLADGDITAEEADILFKSGGSKDVK